MILIALAVCIALLTPAFVLAEVTRVEITSRREVMNGRSFGTAGSYEELVGRIHFSIDPSNPRNQIITDLEKAPRNADGRVELSADLSVLRPTDPNLGNGTVLLDVVNRGRKTVLSGFNRATQGDAYGDGFLLRQGYAIVWVGWEFDVPPTRGAIRIDVPVASGTTGVVRATFTPNASRVDSIRELSAYPPINTSAPENTLRVRRTREETFISIGRDRWELDGDVVNLAGGFKAGWEYEVAYATQDPPVSGLGFAAVRDTIAWIKYSADSPVSATHALAFGSSQSGRFLRDFLYHGFNTDESDRQVFDAVIPHIAGSSRTDLNQRWSTPISQGMFSATSFPFADTKQRDPVTGDETGLLDNPRAQANPPKVFYTDTGVEYWGGGRVAALVHTTPDGLEDLILSDNVRFYFLTGTQHGPAAFPPALRNGQQKDNPTDYWWIMRGLLVAMEQWINEGTVPPPSSHPRLSDGTLVAATEVAFPTLPGVSSPQTLSAGVRAANPLLAENGAPGTQLPLLVPQVNSDGNEISGVRHPEVAVPLATYTGWNFRNPVIGGPSRLYPLIGTYKPFAITRAEADLNRDPRPSIEERYTTREDYLRQVREAAEKLVGERYLLAEDLSSIVTRAAAHWDFLMGSAR